MTQPGFVFDYLTKCRYESSHTLSPGEDCLQGILQAVVIPVLAERGHLFSTLASLAGNAPDKLERTLVICVVNNRPCPYTSAEAIENNQRTLEILRELGRGRLPPFEEGGGFLIEDCRRILQGRLRLAYVDASSPGRELPLKQGGVGLARKIGLDAALCVMDFTGSDPGLLLCLDADSPVDRNYLSAVRRFYEGRKPGAAVVPYAHPLPANPKLLAAIVRYELQRPQLCCRPGDEPPRGGGGFLFSEQAGEAFSRGNHFRHTGVPVSQGFPEGSLRHGTADEQFPGGNGPGGHLL